VLLYKFTYNMVPKSNREDYQNCSVLYCVLKLCTVISTLRLAVLTVLWIGFCHAGPISPCIDSFVFMCFQLHMCYVIVTRAHFTMHRFICVYVFSTAYVLCYCNTVRWTWWDLSLILGTIFLQCFDTVGWVIWPVKTRPRCDL